MLNSGKTSFWAGSENGRFDSEEDFPDLDDGEFLKKYEKEELIGHGNFGEVWRVKGHTNMVPMAAKVIPKREELKEEDLMKLKEEVDALKSLAHPNIIQFCECFNETSNLYIVMEFVSGITLKDVMSQKQPVSEDNIRKYAFQILLALEHCLENAVVHRDLKPDNILLTQSVHNEPMVKLIDFGFSSKVDLAVHSVEEKILDSWCGTPFYASPQIFLRKKYSFKTDFWSLGVVLFELLSGGTKPFRQMKKGPEGQQQMIQQIIKGTYKKKKKAWSSISQNAKNFIDSLIVVNEDDRFGPKDCFAHDWLKLLRRSHPILPRKHPIMESRTALGRFSSAGVVLDAAEFFYELAQSEKKRPREKFLTSGKDALDADFMDI